MLQSHTLKGSEGGLRLCLYQPDIPGNTGTILRLAACFGLTVDIIEPAGFRLDDKALRRAGMDYLERAAFVQHSDWHAFEAWRQEQSRRLVLLTTKSEKAYTDFSFKANDCLLFGRESGGVPDTVHTTAEEENRLTIPMSEQGRSLNVAISVAMVTGEAMRQINQAG